MAQFYGILRGRAKTPATRLGHKTSGLTAEVNGWEGGARVVARFDNDTQVDAFDIYSTAGSNRRHVGGAWLGTVDADGNFTPSPYVRDRILAEAQAADHDAAFGADAEGCTPEDVRAALRTLPT